jgi:alanine-synthesizing transaminase
LPVALADRMHLLPPYLFGRLNAAKHAKRRAGADVIDLGMGNPNDPTPQPIVDKLCEAVRNPRNHRYSAASGILNLRKEVAKDYHKHFGVEVDPDLEIICTIGSKEGISHLSLALLGPGDTALVPEPAFPIHIYSPLLAGANVITVPLVEGPELVRSLENVTAHLRPKPKALFLNYPHNPTTMVADLDFFREVVRFARQHQVLVIHDFAYRDLVFDGYRAPSFLQAEGAKSVGVEFTTMSKSYNMAGWRVGFCVGNRHMVEALGKIKGYYDYGLFQPVQIASIIAMRHHRQDAEKQAAVYQARRDVLVDGLNRYGWKVTKPRGTMFVWAPIPEKYRDMGSIEFALKMMEDAEVAVSPGRAFGEHGEGFLRFALVENELRLKQAVRQIGKAFKI